MVISATEDRSEATDASVESDGLGPVEDPQFRILREPRMSDSGVH